MSGQESEPPYIDSWLAHSVRSVTTPTLSLAG